MPENEKPLIQVNDLEVVYGSAGQALFGLSLEVKRGSIVTLVGANGAGKTTLIRAITGLLRYHTGAVTGGNIELFPNRMKMSKNLNPKKIVASGLAHVPEGRGILAELSVEENLKLGRIARKSFVTKNSVAENASSPASENASQASGQNKHQVKDGFSSVYEMFPVLYERRKGQAGYLSGGEQQMLAIGRALMSTPEIIVLDEPSLGLAPVIVRDIQNLIGEINRAGTTILLVEQNVSMALDLADTGYVLEKGRVAKQGSAESLRADEEIRNLYLGAKK